MNKCCSHINACVCLSTAIKCTVPVIENGYVPEDTQEYNENEVLHFRCNSGYTRDNRPSMCKKIGSRADWSPTPACECKYKRSNPVYGLYCTDG